MTNKFPVSDNNLDKFLKPYDLGIWRMKPNPIKEKLKNGELTLFNEQRWFVHDNDMNFIGYLSQAGFDFVVVDTEHTPWFGLEGCATAVIAAEAHGIVPFIRVSTPTDTILISKALDMGAYGVCVPHIETADQARAAVAAAKFNAPGWEFGERGFSKDMRYDGYGRTCELVDREEFQKFCNEQTMVVLLPMESMEGINNLEEIISVPGVDMISLSAGDISQCLGYPGQPMHPEVVKVRDKALELCQKKGMPVYMVAYEPEVYKYYLNKGVRCLHVNISTAIRHACYNKLVDVRAEAEKLL